MKKMKWYNYTLICLGFTFQVIIPLIIFGRVIPYSHGTIKSGFTGAGLCAIAIGILFLAIKTISIIRERCSKKWIATTITLALVTTIWSVLGIGIDKVVQFLTVLSHYWWYALIFIVVGGFFYIIEGIMRDGQ